MKVVKFNNGKYAIKEGNWLTGYKFHDLKFKGVKRSLDEPFFKYCQGSLQQINEYKNNLKLNNYEFRTNFK